MTEYDIENDIDIDLLCKRITLPSILPVDNINIASNFLQILLVLKNIKTAFMCSYIEFIDMKELQYIIERRKIVNVKPSNYLFVEIGRYTMIANKSRTESVLRELVSKSTIWTTDRIVNFLKGLTHHHKYDSLENKVIASLLSYDCTLQITPSRKIIKVRYALRLNDTSKRIFNILGTTMLITVYGFTCSKEQYEQNKNLIRDKSDDIKMYLENTLGLGSITLLTEEKT